MDTVTKAKRSKIMAAVKGKGNRSTEWKIRSRLISAGVSGWRLNNKSLFGTPDFTFESQKVAIFLDGCFWHGCKLCKNIPASNRKFWLQKIEQNRKRDRLVDKKLKGNGWKVIHFWEHSIKKDPNNCLEKILAATKTRRSPRPISET
jgi:DNA mismatch endonuclease (patch repair protein)